MSAPNLFCKFTSARGDEIRLQLLHEIDISSFHICINVSEKNSTLKASEHRPGVYGFGGASLEERAAEIKARAVFDLRYEVGTILSIHEVRIVHASLGAFIDMVDRERA